MRHLPFYRGFPGPQMRGTWGTHILLWTRELEQPDFCQGEGTGSPGFLCGEVGHLPDR